MTKGYVLYTDEGAIGGAAVGTINISIVNATTTNADDSIRITSADGTSFSATNKGIVSIQSATPGRITTFEVTADVTILLTGAHWANGTKGDLTDAILRVLALNDSGVLKWGVALLGGRTIIADTMDSATPTDINLPEEVLVNTALGSDAQVLDAFWFKADFDDDGGAAADLWAVQSGDGDLNAGNADGQWQAWNPTYTGFSADPTHNATWTQIGRVIFLNLVRVSLGTSDATGFTITAPVKAAATYRLTGTSGLDNGASLTSPIRVDTVGNAVTLNLYSKVDATAWTAANTKGGSFAINYPAGPNTIL